MHIKETRKGDDIFYRIAIEKSFYSTEPLYTSFHDEEWGVPVNDDRKLFELLVLAQALAELTWTTILTERETLRFSLSSI